MKKLPWGIIAGVCAILLFYLTLGFVGAYVIFSAIANQTHSAFSPFENWWQILMFIVDLLSLAGFVFSLVMYILKKKDEKGGEIPNEENL